MSVPPFFCSTFLNISFLLPPKNIVFCSSFDSHLILDRQIITAQFRTQELVQIIGGNM